MSPAFWQRLFHRWFIEYNPLYLLSAGLVIVGVNHLSSGLAHSAYGGFAVAAVAELYAWALIASAAFLMRSELRRPAVMLTLLSAVYQCDPTLHTETCAYLGGIGVLAAAVWFGSFVAKLFARSWAMRVRPSRAALALPAFGALGMLLVPPFLHQVNGTRMSSVVALGVFALFAAALWTNQHITSRVELDAWAQKVFTRTLGATWAIWSLLLLSHVWFWSDEFQLKTALFVPVLLLVSTRWLRREALVWLVTASALLLGLLMPEFFATIAFMVAVTLALRALREPSERMRLMAGSVSALYLAVWTLSWWGGSWPGHVLWLDSLLTAALLGMIWFFRAYVAFAPLALSYLHYAVKTGLLAPPRTRAQWGMSEVALGFVLLGLALFTSWHLRNPPPGEHSSAADPNEDP